MAASLGTCTRFPDVAVDVKDHLPSDVVRLLMGRERRAAMAIDQLGCVNAIHSIHKHAWEAEMDGAMDDAKEQRTMFAGREAGLQYEKSELQLAALEATKESYLLRVNLESALDDLELAKAHQQVLEALVTDMKELLAAERLQRQRMTQRWHTVREQAQQEQRARLLAQKERDDLATALQAETAARLQSEKELDVRRGEFANLGKSQRALQQRAEQLEKDLISSQAAQEVRAGGDREQVVRLEQQLAGALGDLQKLEAERAAARKESARLAIVVEQQRCELESSEEEHAGQVSALQAELAALRTSHAKVLAEMTDLRMLAGEAGTTVPEKRASRKSRESPTRNLGCALEQAAPQAKRVRQGPGKGAKRAIPKPGKVESSSEEDLAGAEDKADCNDGADKAAQERDGAAGSRKDDLERRMSPRLKRPISAESRQSGKPPLAAAHDERHQVERDPKRAKREPVPGPPATSEQSHGQVPRAPLQAVQANSGPTGSQAEGPKAAKPKRTLAPSASKVLTGLPPREQPKSMFAKTFVGFRVPQLKTKSQAGTTSQEIDQATLMSP